MSAVRAPERRPTPALTSDHDTADGRAVTGAPAGPPRPLTVSPVFVDSTGRHRRRARRVAWVVAALCTIYFALFGAGLTGRPVDLSVPPGVLVGGPSPTTSVAPVPPPPPTTAPAGTRRTTTRPTGPTAKAVVPRTPAPTRQPTFWPSVQPTGTTSVSVSAPSAAATTTTSRTQQETTTSDQPDTEETDTQEPDTEETSTEQTSTEQTSTEQTSTAETDTDESAAVAPSGSSR